MTIVEFIRRQFQELHEGMQNAGRGLTFEQLHWCPGNTSNHIAFNLWHAARTEDNVVHIVLQRKPPPIWLLEGWDQKYGLDPRSQGTGMTHDQAVGVRIPSVEEFLPYMRRVWQGTDAYLSSIGDPDTERVQGGTYKGQLAVDLLYDLLVSHGNRHLGETWTIRGLMGMGSGSPV